MLVIFALLLVTTFALTTRDAQLGTATLPQTISYDLLARRLSPAVQEKFAYYKNAERAIVYP